MVRRRKNKSSRRSRATIPPSISGTDRVERVPGKLLVQISASALFVLPLAVDSLGPRLTTLGSVFQEHRFTNIRVVLHPGMNQTVRVGYAVGYFKIPPQTPPTSMANLYSGAVSRYLDTNDTVPVTMVLNRQTLMNNVRPWYVNNAASGSETLDAIQGVIYALPSLGTALNATLEISYMCEFRGPTLPPVD